MKTLTLTQPWATLVAIGAKRIETRSWSTKYRGPLAIHAAKTYRGEGRFREIDLGEPSADNHQGFSSMFKEGPRLFLNDPRFAGPEGGWRLPLGAVVATCRLVDLVPTAEVHRAVGAEVEGWAPWPGEGIIASPQEYDFGDFTFGRFAWLLADVKPVDPPVPEKGYLGLWSWTPEGAHAHPRHHDDPPSHRGPFAIAHSHTVKGWSV